MLQVRCIKVESVLVVSICKKFVVFKGSLICRIIIFLKFRVERYSYLRLASIIFSTEPPLFGVFHPDCLPLLKRPVREPVSHQRECVLGLGSRPLSLLRSKCRPSFLYTVRMARFAFHLLFASSCHKLTADVHTWPAPGHTAARIDGCSALGGVDADSLSKQTLEPGLLSQSWVTSLGRSALRLRLCIFLLRLWQGWSGLLYRPVSNNCQSWNWIICMFHAAAFWLKQWVATSMSELNWRGADFLFEL